MIRVSFLTVLALFAIGCSKQDKGDVDVLQKKADSVIAAVDTVPHFKGSKVPVLCYHAIREVGKNDRADQKAYSVSPENFEAQIKALSENGYTTITPDEFHDFYVSRKPLPEKPIMITFDDGRKEQFTIGAATLEKYNFKGVFYIMTVSLGRSQYMSRDDVKTLADRGHIVGSHTWDHHMVTRYKGDDWQIQITKPKKMLEALTQKPVTSFAYPNGAWNAAAADSLKANGFTTAFLFGTKQDSERPLFTIERLNGPNISNIEKFLKRVENAAAAPQN